MFFSRKLTPDSPPVVLITGASTGVGLALARRLVGAPFRVVLTARESSLRRLQKETFFGDPRFTILPLDVTSAQSRQALIAEIDARLGGVDILVNNAGISYRSVIEHMSDDDLSKQIDTNFHGPLSLIRLVLPGMRKKGRGRIINISSVGGMMAMPTMGAYSASKWALEGASEALWYETRPWDIRVTLVQPGFINSDSFKHVYLNEKAKASSLDPQDPYHEYYRHMAPFILKLMRKSPSSAEDVAQVVYKALTMWRPPLRMAATRDAWIFGLIRRVVPRGLYHWLLYLSLPGIRQWRNTYRLQDYYAEKTSPGIKRPPGDGGQGAA
ncbi:MAG TPA: SDR family oxidoreductase [Bdellovibrionota bacterium]|nr:SDR family oxidoreductase [Bdellovibrionota bacterium]